MRVGILTSGGDCQALNADNAWFSKSTLTNKEKILKLIGFLKGYQG